MGGRALNFETRRVDAEEYNQITQEVVNKLTPYCKALAPTRSYHSKEDFGDLDVLVNSWTPKKGKDPHTVIKAIFNPKDYVKNGRVYSFDYKDFQIDLILFGEELYNSAYFYYSFNDLNNFVGKIYHNLGFKFGHEGLSFKLIRGQYKREKILTRDPKTIYNLIGLDYDKWVTGFETKEDIFNFVISSPFFSVNYYYNSMMNHRTRVRDKKRKTFQEFRAFLKEKEVNQTYHPTPSDFFDILIQFKEDKPFTFIQRFYQKIWVKEKIAKKFNGNHVMEWTGLKGKELGKFMEVLPINQYADDFWTQEMIKNDVIDYYKIIHENDEEK